MGGAEFLFLRMASILVDLYHIDVHYVDYEDGFAANYVHRNSKINFIPQHVYSKTLLPSETVVVAPLSSMFDVATQLKGIDIKVFFWSIHPVGLEEFFAKLLHKIHIKFDTKEKTILGGIIDLLIENDSLYFMDEPNYSYQKEVFKFKSTEEKYLPIPLAEKHLTSKYTSNPNINLAWVGRLSEDKIFSLINILNCCNEYLLSNDNQKIVFHIIGDGPKRYLLESFELNSNLQLIYRLDLSDSSLQSYLKENIEVLFAMGTSALEGASLSIATILVDFSYQPMSTKYFRWIYEAKGFSLGNPHQDGQIYGTSFETIMDIIKKNNLGQYASKSYEYFLKNHSLEGITEKFLKILDASTINLHTLKETKLKAYFWINKLRTIIQYLKFICKKS